jgi:FkbM family methyltransferase
MNYIVFGAGKTAYTVKRYIDNCKLDDSIVGFFDFYDNNPFNLNLLTTSDISSHRGKFIIGSIMQDSIIAMKQMASSLFNIQEEDIFQIADILSETKIDETSINELQEYFDDSFLLYQEVIAARASFNFEYFQFGNFAQNISEEYLKYNLIRSGDVIIDGGSFDGSTARIFSKIIGENGQVFSFDCDLENISSQNRLPNICYFDFALYDSQRLLNFHKYQGIEAPGSFVSEIDDLSIQGLSVKAVDLDSFNKKYMNGTRINFIKLDIEGAELKALEGAENLIIRDQPKLAIACYHLLEHYWEIPKLVLSFNPNYRIGFDHYSEYFDGSVLYFY